MTIIVYDDGSPKVQRYEATNSTITCSVRAAVIIEAPTTEGAPLSKFANIAAPAIKCEFARKTAS